MTICGPFSVSLATPILSPSLRHSFVSVQPLMLNWSALLIYPILQSPLPVANSELECHVEELRSFLHLQYFQGYFAFLSKYIFRTIRVHRRRTGLLKVPVAGDRYYPFSRTVIVYSLVPQIHGSEFPTKRALSLGQGVEDQDLRHG